MKKYLFFYFLLCLFSSCSKDDDANSVMQFSAEALIGSWDVVETINPPSDYSEEADGKYETKTYVSGNYTYTFNEFAKLNIYQRENNKTFTYEYSYTTYLKTLTIIYNDKLSISWDVEQFDDSIIKLHRKDWIYTSTDENAMKVWCEWWMTLKRRK